jgi:hypothetical protein
MGGKKKKKKRHGKAMRALKSKKPKLTNYREDGKRKVYVEREISYRGNIPADELEEVLEAGCSVDFSSKTIHHGRGWDRE